MLSIKQRIASLPEEEFFEVAAVDELAEASKQARRAGHENDAQYLFDRLQSKIASLEGENFETLGTYLGDLGDVQEKQLLRIFDSKIHAESILAIEVRFLIDGAVCEFTIFATESLPHHFVQLTDTPVESMFGAALGVRVKETNEVCFLLVSENAFEDNIFILARELKMDANNGFLGLWVPDLELLSGNQYDEEATQFSTPFVDVASRKIVLKLLERQLANFGRVPQSLFQVRKVLVY